VGSLLVISSLMGRAADQVGAAREALIIAARRLLDLSSNIGAVVAIIFGIAAIAIEPAVLARGWLYVKLLFVLGMIGAHAQLYRRIVAAERDPGSATRGEFTTLHGIVSTLLAVILAMVFLKPF
jgi:uncharacterized membrane protein